MSEATGYVLGISDTAIVGQGLADEAELGLETLEERIAEQVAARDAVVLAPTVVGAWRTRPAVRP